MNSVEVNISKWTFFLAMIVLLICISCTKEEIGEEDSLDIKPMHIDNPQDHPKPPVYSP